MSAVGFGDRMDNFSTVIDSIMQRLYKNAPKGINPVPPQPPPLVDRAPLEVDEAYRQGINAMGSGPPVGFKDWFDALASTLSSAVIMRGGVSIPEWAAGKPQIKRLGQLKEKGVLKEPEYDQAVNEFLKKEELLRQQAAEREGGSVVNQLERMEQSGAQQTAETAADIPGVSYPVARHATSETHTAPPQYSPEGQRQANMIQRDLMRTTPEQDAQAILDTVGHTALDQFFPQASRSFVNEMLELTAGEGWRSQAARDRLAGFLQNNYPAWYGVTTGQGPISLNLRESPGHTADFLRDAHQMSSPPQIRELPDGYAIIPRDTYSQGYGYTLVGPDGFHIGHFSNLRTASEYAHERARVAVSRERAWQQEVEELRRTDTLEGRTPPNSESYFPPEVQRPRVESIQVPPERNAEGMLNSPRLPPSLTRRSGTPMNPDQFRGWEELVLNLEDIFRASGRAVDQNREAARLISGILGISQRNALGLMAMADRYLNQGIRDRTYGRSTSPYSYADALRDAYRDVHGEIISNPRRRRR